MNKQYDGAAPSRGMKNEVGEIFDKNNKPPYLPITIEYDGKRTIIQLPLTRMTSPGGEILGYMIDKNQVRRNTLGVAVTADAEAPAPTPAPTEETPVVAAGNFNLKVVNTAAGVVYILNGQKLATEDWQPLMFLEVRGIQLTEKHLQPSDIVVDQTNQTFHFRPGAMLSILPTGVPSQGSFTAVYQNIGVPGSPLGNVSNQTLPGFHSMLAGTVPITDYPYINVIEESERLVIPGSVYTVDGIVSLDDSFEEFPELVSEAAGLLTSSAASWKLELNGEVRIQVSADSSKSVERPLAPYFPSGIIGANEVNTFASRFRLRVVTSLRFDTQGPQAV